MRHFDLCVIGSGSGNSIVDERFSGWKVALVDGQTWFGGTCLNVGCIPTKMFAHVADLAEDARHGAALGIDVGGVHVRWPDVRDRIFGRIDAIVADGEAYRRDTTTLFRETARFVGPRTLRVGEEEITADRFVIAAGSRPFLPAVPGIDDPELADRVHTSDSIPPARVPSCRRSPASTTPSWQTASTPPTRSCGWRSCRSR
jgi:mycothione reductase